MPSYMATLQLGKLIIVLYLLVARGAVARVIVDTQSCEIMRMLGMCCHGEVIRQGLAPGRGY